MSRTTVPAEADEEAQPQPLEVQQPPPPPPPLMQPQASVVSPSPMAILALILRIVTWVFLMVSMIIIVTTSATYQRYDFHFNDIYSYRYVLAVSVLGLVYTKLQLPSSIYLVIKGKPLWKNTGFLIYDFLGDKVLLLLIATGVGAAFAATLDLKSRLDNLDNTLQDYGDIGLAQLRERLDDFFNKAYASAAFLLLALLTTLASSIVSSLALTKKP